MKNPLFTTKRNPLAPRMSRRLAARFLAPPLLAAALHAQSPIFNDTFADGERRTQNLPTSLAWHVGVTRATALTVRNGALALGFAGTNFTVWGYFPPVSLNVGDSITLSVDFSATALPVADGDSSGLRFALCYTNGVAPLVSDGSGPVGNFQGYMINSTATSLRGVVHKRSGPAAATARLLASVAVTGDPATVVWPSLGTNQINGAGGKGVRLRKGTSMPSTSDCAPDRFEGGG
jgi:hypothetical protein